MTSHDGTSFDSFLESDQEGTDWALFMPIGFAISLFWIIVLWLIVRLQRRQQLFAGGRWTGRNRLCGQLPVIRESQLVLPAINFFISGYSFGDQILSFR